MSRKICVDCGANRGIQTFKDGTWCYACHKLTKDNKLIVAKIVKKKILEMPEFKDCTIPLPETYFLDQFYIKDRLNIYWSEQYQRICFPYNNYKSCWMRTLDKTKKDKWVFVGEKALYWLAPNLQLSLASLGQVLPKWKSFNLLITEDVISAIRCAEHYDAVALGGTNVNQKELLPIILRYDSIILWLDADDAGRKASEKFVKRYSHLRPIKVINTPNDPKCYTASEMEKILNNV